MTGHYTYRGQATGLWLGANDPQSQSYLHAGKYDPTKLIVKHGAYGPILSQGDVGACAGFSDADIMNMAKFSHARWRGSRRRSYLGNSVGLRFYHEATVIDEWPGEQYPPDDNGTSVLAAMKALKADGFIDRYEWGWDIDTFIAALQHQPVVLGTLWTDGMSEPSPSGLIRVTGDVVGGHAYSAYQLNLTTGRAKCRNHWTPRWGVSGDFWLDLEDVDWLLAEQQQGEVGIPIPV